MKKLFHLRQWSKKAKIIWSIIIIVTLGITAFYRVRSYLQMTYVKGAVQTYIYAQRIPQSEIKNKRIWYHWIDENWYEDVTIKKNGKTFVIEYMVPLGGNQVTMLDITDANNNSLSDKQIKKYHLPEKLAYDHHTFKITPIDNKNEKPTYVTD